MKSEPREIQKACGALTGINSHIAKAELMVYFGLA
jgi:hypothetical protein